jgi:uncharacterized damage-inducible protein DinB
MKHYFTTLVRYHGWATRKLYTHVDTLSDDEYRRDAGLFFKSVHGTLNHLLVGELIWLPRFAEGTSPRRALNEEVEADRARLRERLLEAPAKWQAVIDALDDRKLQGRIDYTTTKGLPMSLPFAATLGHVFNHGTHHRGQISAAITAMGHACPEIDLVWMLQEESAAR